MIEFGSDYHFIAPKLGAGKTLYDFYPIVNMYADGRQALIHLYYTEGWERLWVPTYYCYEVIRSLMHAGLNLRFYADYPGSGSDSEILESIQRRGLFKKTDAILRVNYFGTRSYRTSEELSEATVIEDHTHDLIGDWTMNSQADWCIASLRKTLPIPEGGILWSPRGLRLPRAPEQSEENERIASIRWGAMKQKARYLEGDSVEKASFRARFVDTEVFFETAPVSAIDNASRRYLHSFDVQDWYNGKRENWIFLKALKNKSLHVLCPEGFGCYPFSLVLIFDDFDERDRVRKELIENHIYPSILWSMPFSVEGNIFRFSRRMLSIHCDARYSKTDIIKMKSSIDKIL